MRQLLITSLLSIALSSLIAVPCPGIDPISDPQSSEAKWKSLFNGRDFVGWRNSAGWTIDNGAIFCGKRPPDEIGGLQYTAKPLPEDLELLFEYKVQKKRADYMDGYFALCDGLVHTDATDPRQLTHKINVEHFFQVSGNKIILATNRMNLGSVLPQDSLSFSLSPVVDAERPAGEWNQATIVIRGDDIEHWLNSKRIVAAKLSDLKHQPANRRVIPLFDRWIKFKGEGLRFSIEWGGTPAWYRNIKFRSLRT